MAPVSVRLLVGDAPLPSAEEADERGLVAVGGDLRPERLLDGYSRGIFPWYEDGLPVLWHSPDPRFVLIPTQLQIARSLRKSIRKAPYRITLDEDFSGVIRACARAKRPGQRGTWITHEMIAAYQSLHESGHAHSCETWLGDTLVGGVYGVGVGGVFCGESMFAAAPDASKIAFAYLVAQLQRWGVELIDCQVHTEHLERFGACEWPRSYFLDRLARISAATGSLEVARPSRWRFEPELVSAIASGRDPSSLFRGSAAPQNP